MFKQISVILLSILSTLALSQTAMASDDAVAPATVIIYRADEASKTKKVKFQVRLDKSQIGKLRYGKALVTTVKPGTYTLDTTLQGSGNMQLELHSGQTYFVYTSLRKLGNTLTSELELVEEQVAVAQQPAISNVI